ncbi:hypothetical protein [Mucilaginibacter terrae]|uniref:hypothetical protein n=1 Tax=Mucilaginibacter terrae TaxID=1955052 RepID=UPI00366CF885
MKKVICMMAIAAISFGTVFAHGSVTSVKTDATQQDTIKKKKKDGKMKKKTKRDTTKRDTMKM